MRRRRKEVNKMVERGTATMGGRAKMPLGFWAWKEQVKEDVMARKAIYFISAKKGCALTM
jgi:hypothetical protein